MEIPGFYYDKTKKKYFKIQAGNSGQNRLTKEDVKAKTALDSLVDYTRVDTSIHLPQTLHKQEIDSRTKYSLKEEFIRSHLKAIKKQLSYNVEVIDFCGDNMKNVTIQSMIGSPEMDKLFAVFTGDSGSVIYQFSIDDIFSDEFDLIKSREVINAFSKPNRVVDMSFSNSSSCGVLTSVVQHFPNPYTINTSFSLNILTESQRINPLRQVYEFAEPIFSATHFEDTNILGAEKQIYVFKPSHSGSIKIIKTNDTITALSTGCDGKFFIAGTNKGQLSCFDIKDLNSLSRKSSFRVHDRSVVNIQCLSDSYGVIASCHNHCLCLTDLRMFNKPVLQYSGHLNNCSKIPFSVDESVDVLCSSGDDNLVRFWSISSGKLLHMYSPQSEDRELINGLPSALPPTSVWYSHSWKCLNNQFKPLLFSVSGNQLSVITTETMTSS